MPINKSDLAQFTGSETYYRVGSNGVLCTEGARYLANHGAAYWLLDLIAISQGLEPIRSEPFQHWTLDVADNRGTLTCTDGGKGENDGKPVELVRLVIPYTDFPLGRVSLFVEGGPDMPVILLPSEH